MKAFGIIVSPPGCFPYQWAQLQVGHGRSGNGISQIDLISDGVTHTDFGFRIIRAAGVSTTQLLHRGSSDFSLETPDGADIILSTNGTTRMNIATTGGISIGGSLGIITNSTGTGMKLAARGQDFGIGFQTNVLEFITTSGGGGDYRWGYGTSGSLTETMFLDSGTATLRIANIEGGVFVVGNADEVQTTFKSHSTQTSNITEWTTSSSTVVSHVTGTGGAYFADDVGIGINSPSGRLHVKDLTSGTSKNVIICDFGGASSNTGIQVNGSTLGGTTNIGIDISNISDVGATTAMRIGTGWDNGLIVESGNVGIGTTSPGFKLVVENSATASTDSDFSIRSGNTGEANILMGDTDISSSGQIKYDNNVDAMSFHTLAIERIRITSAGNVVIGGTSTSAHFHINNTSDQIAEIIEGHSTQNANLTEWHTSSSTVNASMSVEGYFEAKRITLDGVLRNKAHRTVTNADSPVTLDADDNVLLCDCSSGAITVNFPAASTSEGFSFMIMKTDSSSNNVVLDPNAAELIDGLTTKTFNTQWESYNPYCNGTSWFAF